MVKQAGGIFGMACCPVEVLWAVCLRHISVLISLRDGLRVMLILVLVLFVNIFFFTAFDSDSDTFETRKKISAATRA